MQWRTCAAATSSLNPFDSNHALVTSGGGVWTTKDLTAADAGQATHWFFDSKNLEETAVRDLVSPPANAPIIAGDPRVYGRIYVAPGGRGILYGEPRKN